MIVRTILISAAALLVALPAEAKPKKKKTPSLTAAVAKAHARIDGMNESAETIPEMIESLGVFKGKFIVTCQRIDIQDAPDGKTLKATLRAKRGLPSRYRTEDERKQILYVNDRMKSAKEELKIALQDALDGKKSETEKKRKPSSEIARDYKQRVREAKREFDGKTKQAKKQIVEVGKRIRVEEEKRKAACETIYLDIRIDGDIPDEWMKKPKMKLYATVESFELGAEPEELGAAPRIAKLKLECVKFAKP